MSNTAFKIITSIFSGLKKVDQRFDQWDREATYRFQDRIASGMTHEDALEILQKETIKTHEANKRLLPMTVMLGITCAIAASFFTYATMKDNGQTVDSNEIGVTYNLKTGDTSLLGVDEYMFDPSETVINNGMNNSATGMDYIQTSYFNESFADIDESITTLYIEAIDQGSVFSSGEAYDPNAMVIAYSNLPINTIVKVMNEQGSYVYARVADSGVQGHAQTIRPSQAIAKILSLNFDLPQTVLRVEVDQEKTVMAHLLMTETGVFQTPNGSLSHIKTPEPTSEKNINTGAPLVDEKPILAEPSAGPVVNVAPTAPIKPEITTETLTVTPAVKLKPTYVLQFGAYRTAKGASDADTTSGVSCSTVVPTQKVILPSASGLYKLSCLYNNEADARKAQGLTTQETIVKPLTESEKRQVRIALGL